MARINSKEDIETILRKELLDATHLIGEDLLTRSVEKIFEVFDCAECSLWSINSNSTLKDYEGISSNTVFESTTLVYRVLNKNISFEFSDDSDYVHELDDSCLFGKALIKFKGGESFYRASCQDVKEGHRNKRFCDEIKPDDIIAIPICDYNDSLKAIAIFEFSFINKTEHDWDRLSKIIQEFFSSAFYRYTLIRQQQLMDDLVKLHGEGGEENLFERIINKILEKHCHCDAASFFLWDNRQKRYNLAATTGIIGNPKKSEVYYKKGEGLTGMVCEKMKPFIHDQNSKRESPGKYQEIADKDAKTLMFIPINRLSGNKETIGIFRFVNKRKLAQGVMKELNPQRIIDYFNDTDVSILTFASNYLSLTIDYFIREEDRVINMAKLSHEFLTPSVSIHKTADRLLRHVNDEGFIAQYQTAYLEDICTYAESLKWQVKTTLIVTNDVKKIFDEKYKIKKTSIFRVYDYAKHIAIPIARKWGVQFDNIFIYRQAFSIPDIYVDENAFVTVFYNLFTNAIKYHDRNYPQSFCVRVYNSIKYDRLEILIQDWGIGIDTEDRNDIFDMGFRGKNALQYEGEGFGIGLTAVRQIIEDFGGTISITSFKHPTEFTIILPETIFQNI